ncbi:MAG: DUF3108 domain-containing protein [Paramuribaculum sp.]|nr:DUF3108 domain-containing protein [Paramuribaculum sp.]
MLRILIAVCLFISGVTAQAARTTPSEALHYKVLFKWGLINKKAGTADLTLTPRGNYLIARLTAKNESWADGFYKLRDTLTSHIDPVSMPPNYYERIAHEAGKYARVVVLFSRRGGEVTARTERVRSHDPNEVPDPIVNSLVATGVTVDMVSAFYYLRNLDFSHMTPGESKVINIFSAKRKELLRITFHGEEKVRIDKRDYDTWRISFTFTTDGSKKSSDSIDTWITTGGNHKPVKLRGKLKIGSILCLLEE